MYCYNCGSAVPESASFCPVCGTALVRSAQPQGRIATQDSAHTKWGGKRRVFLAFLMFLLVIPFEVLGYVIGDFAGIDQNIAIYVGGTVGVVLGMLALGWRNLIIPRMAALKESFRMGWWLLTCSGLLMLFELVTSAAEGYLHVAEGWPQRTFGILVMCLGIGICEEGMFRGLLFGGLLSGRRGTDGDVRKMAIITSVLFGLAHVEWWALNYSDPLAWVQAVLKVMQTGILGMFLAAVVIKTKNITGSMLLHGLSDFLLMVSSVGFMDETPDVEYVASGPDSLLVAIIYSVVILMYMPLLIRAIRVFAKPCTSPFTQA